MDGLRPFGSTSVVFRCRSDELTTLNMPVLKIRFAQRGKRQVANHFKSPVRAVFYFVFGDSFSFGFGWHVMEERFKDS